jgi:hypothetical protein
MDATGTEKHDCECAARAFSKAEDQVSPHPPQIGLANSRTH